ncbi:hypothetical protein ASPZODRAFT_184744 [Penicilliopsis zonata CBS 506.65]|uniref:Uncharacterized protein n=1 Tax=Penicilliopsis zonata CBS 506.65 TaxID=1073090 RepID=A0A1L9STN7_9EURO|nr:hypothetical protein ASPZODRAFT_184744 [Penicilliopsis zonata CBS 506.65]OJJ50484.1 hypothetical protein ASPZODRAFT_184744 [Penicilliopsis zonata CBS 506.65]
MIWRRVDTRARTTTITTILINQRISAKISIGPASNWSWSRHLRPVARRLSQGFARGLWSSPRNTIRGPVGKIFGVFGDLGCRLSHGATLSWFLLLLLLLLLLFLLSDQILQGSVGWTPKIAMLFAMTLPGKWSQSITWQAFIDYRYHHSH